jgi:outer membrane protein assembly factor BamD
MNLLKILFTCFLLLLAVACATKDQGASAFKNYTAKQLLTEGELNLKKNNYNDALKRFEALDALYPFDAEAKQGQLDAIYAYYKTDDYASALAASDRYIHLHPDGEHADYAYYMKGVTNFDRDRNWMQKIYSKDPQELDLSNLREAFVDFDDLIRLFPNSIYVKDAQKRMYYIRSLMAEHELAIAKFYFNHKAYVAAANRASEVVAHFEGSSQVPEALKIMIKSYQALGANKQANDTLKVLQVSFPQENI